MFYGSRLFYLVCEYYNSTPVAKDRFPLEQSSMTQALEQCVNQLLSTKITEPFPGLHLSFNGKEIINSVQTKKLHPIENELLNEFFHGTTYDCFSQEESGKELALSKKEKDIYEDLTHWHNDRLLAEESTFVPKTKADIAYAEQVKESLMRYSDCIHSNEKRVIRTATVEQFPSLGAALKKSKKKNDKKSTPTTPSLDPRAEKLFNTQCEEKKKQSVYLKTASTQVKIYSLQVHIDELLKEFQKNQLQRSTVCAVKFVESVLMSLLELMVQNANEQDFGLPQLDSTLECFLNIKMILDHIGSNEKMLQNAVSILLNSKLGLLVSALAKSFNLQCSSIGCYTLEEVEEAQLNVQPKYLNALYPLSYQHKHMKLPFKPDDWQLEVIKHVDYNFEYFARKQEKYRSVVVSAPTSAGKSLITYYIVEKLLELKDDDSIMVFVQPTNALVNQVYAEIEARFVKEGYKNSMHKLGVFTATSKINVTTSQVLITNPPCFEILLLSHANIDWIKKLKYVILDEVHNIASMVGQQLEHILCLIQCPFIALSATIGNAQVFLNWLHELALSKGNETIEFVPNSKNEIPRSQPLLYYGFIPVTQGREVEGQNAEVAAIHPWTVIDSQKLEDQIQRLHALSAAQLKQFCEMYPNICAESIWNSLYLEYGCIHQSAVQEANRLMKEKLQNMVHNKQKDHVIEILTNLTEGYETEKVFNKLDKVIDETDNFEDNYLMQLVHALKEKKLLPAIAFLFNKLQIERFMGMIIAYLIAADQTLFEDSVIEASVKLEADALAKSLRIEMPQLKMYILYKQQDRSMKKVVVPALQLREECSKLQNEGSTITNMGIVSIESSQLVIVGFRFGLAAHHNSLDEILAREVERMFRLRRVPLLFATGTLSFGLNMPCKTVCLLGVSQYLRNDIFIQCAGRAGRRNLDVKGNVILYGMQSATIKRYLSCAYPNIFSFQSVSAAFIVRLLTFYTNALKHLKSREIVLVKATCLRTLRNLIAETKDMSVQLMLKQSIRFILDFLRREKYLNEKGEPINFAGLVYRLFYLEPNNFILVHLIRRGVFASVILKEKDFAMESIPQVITVVASLLGGDSRGRKTREVPREVLREISEYNKVVFDCFSNFFATFAKSEESNKQLKDTKLPLSQWSFESNNMEESKLSTFITQNQLHNVITSSFYGLSGAQDQMKNPSSIVNSSKHTFVFDFNSIPFNMRLRNKVSAHFIDVYRHAYDYVYNENPETRRDPDEVLSELAEEYGFLSLFAMDRSIRDFLQEIKKMVVFSESTGVKAEVPDLNEDPLIQGIRQFYEICKCFLNAKELSYYKKLHFALWRVNYEAAAIGISERIEVKNDFTQYKQALQCLKFFWRRNTVVLKSTLHVQYNDIDQRLGDVVKKLEVSIQNVRHVDLKDSSKDLKVILGVLKEKLASTSISTEAEQVVDQFKYQNSNTYYRNNLNNLKAKQFRYKSDTTAFFKAITHALNLCRDVRDFDDKRRNDNEYYERLAQQAEYDSEEYDDNEN